MKIDEGSFCDVHTWCKKCGAIAVGKAEDLPHRALGRQCNHEWHKVAPFNGVHGHAKKEIKNISSDAPPCKYSN